MTMPHHGAKISTRITSHIVRAIIATHKGLLATKHKLAMLVFRAISDEISHEVDHTLGTILAGLHDSSDESSPLHNLLKFMAYDHGQLKAIAGSSLVSQSLLWPISQIANNVLAPIVYTAVANDPRTIPDIGTLATLAATGRMDFSTTVHNIAKQGFDAPFANPIIDAARTYPDIGQATDLLNRGDIGAGQFDAWAAKNGIPGNVSAELRKLATQPISPADAALGLLRGNIDTGAAHKVAADWGLSVESFNVLLGNTGEPPGTMQLLEAYRRKFINEDTLKKGILQSRVRNEWIPVLEKLRYEPMSVADAVNGVVQSHVSEDDAKSIADQNGLTPGAVELLIQIAGEPLSRTELEQLYNRGLITADQVKQGLRESRLKPKYTDMALALHVRLLEPRMLSSAVEFGAVTHADAVKRAMDYGFSKTDAIILVDEGSKRKLKTYHDRIVASIESLYEENAISRQAAQGIITKNGYSDTEAALILQTAEYRRESKLIASTVAAIRSKFIAHHIDVKQASASLTAAGIPAGQRDQYLGFWSIEQAANVRTLTTAQIVKAVHLKLIDIKDGEKRLIDSGYATGDAVLLLMGA